ncbi:unnamed protein product [Symbiodinium natans]|uniref:Microbial-type PARG catalytic domain-containing protein n=1 Tax=Symbiodinium natans TaxID=878477 RepID=A0A812PXP7_9DINO|nr:unnamed protein product [Symbiodinium natans]
MRRVASARPYSVASARAKTQLKCALTAKSLAARQRRVQQVLQQKVLEPTDAETNQLLVIAARQLKERLHPVRVEETDTGGGGCVGGGGGEPEQVEGKAPDAVPALPQVDVQSRGRAPDSHGYDWIRKANDEKDRAARREISELTKRVTAAGGYQLGSSVVPLCHVQELVAETKLFSPSLATGAVWPQLDTTGDHKTKLLVKRGTVLDVAVEEVLHGQRVVAVNAASAYHAGGGFQTGGRHALEEAMCIQSTLYASLEKGIVLAEQAKIRVPPWVQPPKRAKDGQEWVSHLPDDGALLSPHVEVFRTGTNSGYAFQEKAVCLEAVVSVAMPNCNTKMSDSPVDAHPDKDKYAEQLADKWRAVMMAASSRVEANVLVVPDAGCGVFFNPPEKVGESFGKVLREEFSGRFESVVIAFPGGKAGETFAAAAVEAFEGEETLKPQRL